MIDAGFIKDIEIEEAARVKIKTDLPDNLKSIAALEKRMQKTVPEVKERLSKYIERGTIAQKVK
jgi:uncharacterized protein HemX